MSENWLTNPSQSQRRHCYPQLRSRYVGVQIVKQSQQTTGALISGGGERLNTRTAHTHESKFRCHKKAVRKDQEKYDDSITNANHEPILLLHEPDVKFRERP